MMALSAIEDRYLSALTEREFPTFTPEQSAMAAPEGVDSVQLAAGPSGTVSDAGSGMPEMRATPRNPVMGVVADFVRGVRDLANQYEIKDFVPLLGGMGVGDLLVGKSPEELEEWAYGNAPMRIPEMSNVPIVKTGRKEQLMDTMFLGVDAAGIGKGAAMTGKAAVNKLGPTAANMAGDMLKRQGLMPGVVPDGPATVAPVLTRNEANVVKAAAGRKPALKETATKAVKDLHSSYPESDGWMPIEANKIDFKTSKAGNVIAEVETAKIPYDFHTPPEGVPKDAWQSELSARVFDEVQAVVDRANAGDQAAIAILDQASWYRSMRDRLRSEFGGIGDVFADVLGTTSAQTGVEQNFDNAVEILRRFSRGEYDNELRAYEDRLKRGLPVDAKTLTQLYKEGKFPLITKASGQLFNANSPPSMGALLDLFRAVKAGDSPKTPNFTGNLIGLTNEATIDVWAARMLRRVADLPRIPPPAEKGVAGKHLVGSSLYEPNVGSEFGFGQDVFKEAADEINKSGIIKSVAPQIGDLGPDDLQAVAWFIEKEKWTNNGWTSKAGEGGSLDYEMSLAGADDPKAVKDLRRSINKGFSAPKQLKSETDEQYAARVQDAKAAFEADRVANQQQLSGMQADVDRFSLGVSGERPDRPMSNYAQAELAAEFDDVVRDDPSVVTYNLANTYGSFMAKTERALNAEFVARQNFNPLPLERRLVEQGKAYDQDAVFMSKVLKDGALPNARPGVEIYFKQKVTPEQMEKVTEMLRKYGVDGFTYVTDMRFSDRINVQAKAGGADTAGLNGIRFQYIPEFDDSFNAANRALIMQQKEDLFRDIVSDILDQGNVSDARMLYYDTKVFFRSDYDEYLARTAGTGNPEARGKQPGSSNAARPNPSGEVRKVTPRSVPDRDSRKTGLVSSQEVKRGRQAPNQGAN